MVLSQITKKGNSVILSFDNDEQINIPYELYVQIAFFKGDEITDDQKVKLIEKIEIFRIKQSAFRYLSGRNHSKNELRFKLVKKGYEKKLITNVIIDFERLGYLNDKDFTHQFYLTSLKKKKGLSRIKADLFSKGVDRNIVEEVGEKFLDDPILIESAQTLAEKKIIVLNRKDINKNQKKQKLYQFLLGRGFSGDIIHSVINKVKLD